LWVPGPGPRCEDDTGETLKVFDEMGGTYRIVRGVPGPPFLTSSCIDELQRDFSLRSDDIVIATYPKCGTTWMQQILVSLLFQGDKSKAVLPMEQAPWIEATVCRKRQGATGESFLGRAMSAQEFSEWSAPPGFEAPPRRAFKTHATIEMVPWKGGIPGLGGAKVVLVTRNPKDACISLFHHTREQKFAYYKGDFVHFVTGLFLPGRATSGCFWKWYAGWEEATAKYPDTIIWVSYEELKRDFPATVKRIADFLQIPISDEAIRGTMDSSSFKSMKASFGKREQELEAMGAPTKKNHIRKGEMGSWRDDIHGALLVEFDAVSKAKTAQYDLKYGFDYGDP